MKGIWGGEGGSRKGEYGEKREAIERGEFGEERGAVWREGNMGRRGRH